MGDRVPVAHIVQCPDADPAIAARLGGVVPCYAPGVGVG